MTRARSSEAADCLPAESLAKTPEPHTADVLSAVSHDLRNPLGTIVLGSSLLMNQFGHEPRARRPLEMIERSAHKMAGLLDLLTDVAALHNGQLELDYEDVSARELVEAASCRKALEQEIPDVTLHCDRNRMCRVLELALSHAIEPVRVHVERSGARIQLVITSTSWRAVDQYLAQSIVVAHGGELWSEGGSVFITLPEA